MILSIPRFVKLKNHFLQVSWQRSQNSVSIFKMQKSSFKNHAGNISAFLYLSKRLLIFANSEAHHRMVCTNNNWFCFYLKTIFSWNNFQQKDEVENSNITPITMTFMFGVSQQPYRVYHIAVVVEHTHTSFFAFLLSDTHTIDRHNVIPVVSHVY